MVLKNKNIQSTEASIELPSEFVSPAGLIVKTSDDVWAISPPGKGCTITISWLHKFDKNSKLKYILMDTLIHYVENSAGSTVSTINFAVQKGFPADNDNYDDFERIWFQLGSSTKKTLKGFLTQCLKLNHKHLKKHHNLASKYLHKSKFQALHPTKGRLTDLEYDSFLHNLRSHCKDIPSSPPDYIDYYTHQVFNSITFINIKNIMACRLLVQLARRPKQISMLKWCDILPVGTSFNDLNIDIEPIFTGAKAFHVRSFKIKQSKQKNSFRLHPEKWSIPLSESFSTFLLNYKKLYIKGLTLAMEVSGIKVKPKSLYKIFLCCPIIPDISIFSADFTDQNMINSLNERSQQFHIDESLISKSVEVYGKGISERYGNLSVSNNRLRHTWLCNAALEGETLSNISKITNVTLPGARQYLQLGLKERQFIDEHYAANELLRQAFNPKQFVSDEDTIIESESVGAVGVERKCKTCNNCEHKQRMVRPLPCYGCSNFRPLLDADHESILQHAIAKQDFINTFSCNSRNNGSKQRLDKAIAYIKLTIAICHETKLRQVGIKVRK
ncbi:hypothetical protein [Pseudocolwellia agarivorans]|uniref:hypothetical protein n=1 Tax=Pseudocolwellia agarivorans TaxID=1911682 RepID=UPI003F88419F